MSKDNGKWIDDSTDVPTRNFSREIDSYIAAYLWLKLNEGDLVVGRHLGVVGVSTVDSEFLGCCVVHVQVGESGQPVIQNFLDVDIKQ